MIMKMKETIFFFFSIFFTKTTRDMHSVDPVIRFGSNFFYGIRCKRIQRRNICVNFCCRSYFSSVPKTFRFVF